MTRNYRSATFDAAYARDLEREPSYAVRRQRVPLVASGTLKSRFGTAALAPISSAAAVPTTPPVVAEKTGTFLERAAIECSCSTCQAFEAQGYEQLLPIVGKE